MIRRLPAIGSAFQELPTSFQEALLLSGTQVVWRRLQSKPRRRACRSAESERSWHRSSRGGQRLGRGAATSACPHQDAQPMARIRRISRRQTAIFEGRNQATESGTARACPSKCRHVDCAIPAAERRTRGKVRDRTARSASVTFPAASQSIVLSSARVSLGGGGGRISRDVLQDLVETVPGGRSPDYSSLPTVHLRRSSAATTSWGMSRPASASASPASIFWMT